MTLQKVRLHPIHAGVGVFVRVVCAPELARLGRATLDALGYVGASSVCFKVDAASEQPFVHEVNGRLPLAHGAGSIVGVDLSYLMYADALGIDSPEPNASRSGGASAWVTVPADIQAFRAYRRNREITLRDWLRSYKDVRLWGEAARDDVRPLYGVVRRHLRNLVRERREQRDMRPA